MPPRAIKLVRFGPRPPRSTPTVPVPASAKPMQSMTLQKSGNRATTLCNDGTYSYAAHQGACSGHGGVQVFFK